MPAVRAAIDYVHRKLGIEHPLASDRFLTNGVALFVKHAGQLLNVSEQGQHSMREDFERALSRIEVGKEGRPVLLFPFTRQPPLDIGQPRTILIDPQRSFGRPVLAKASVRTEVIEQRFSAGDAIAEMAQDYDVSPADIEEALRFERRRAA